MFSEFVLGVFIPLVLILLGVYTYYILITKMKNQGIKLIPWLSWLILFINYGGLLLVSLTSIFWTWSGMASIGVMYLVIIAPLLMSSIAFEMRIKKNDNVYNRRLFRLALLYLLIMPLVLYFLFIFESIY